MPDLISRDAAKAAVIHAIAEYGRWYPRYVIEAALDALPRVGGEEGSEPTEDFWTNLANETVEHFRKALADNT